MLQQEGCHKFKGSLDYIVRHYLKNQNIQIKRVSSQERKDSEEIQKEEKPGSIDEDANPRYVYLHDMGILESQGCSDSLH
ncbi:hypothetical protein STEG23_037668, partial [Scotinomys teguina]